MKQALWRALLASLGLIALSACTPQEIIASVFPDNPGEAVAVADCESGLDPGAVSPGGGNHGLFQINNVHRSAWVNGDPDTTWRGAPWELRYDPILNASFAKQYLYDLQGWRPWACRP